MICSPPSVRGVNVFIFTCFIVYLIQEQSWIVGKSPFLMLAEAGSKSSKSAKTTVIAIDGGGGGKAHPVPVPWPVVHCHHHHHHLKYVPKPVLVHHWVKKEKPYEFAASEHMPYESGNGLAQLIDNLPQEQLLDFGASQLAEQRQNKIIPGNMDSSRNVMMSTSIESAMSDFPSQQQQQQHYNKLPSNQINTHVSLPAKLSTIQQMMTKSQFERELKRRLQHKLANDKQLHQRLNLMQNPKLPQKDDADSDDSLKNISLANSTDSRDHNGSQAIYESPSNNRGFISSDQGPMSAKMILPGRPSHPFDEAHHGDQIRDESQQGSNSHEIQLPNELKLLASLNQREESQAAKLFEKLVLERAEKMQTLAQLNQPRLLQTNQVPTPINQNQMPRPNSIPSRLQQNQRPAELFNPSISARMASTISESNTINTMTRIAEEAAKQEARKLLNKKRATSQQDSTTSSKDNKKSGNSKPESVNFLSKLSTTIRNYGQKDKRRMTTKQFADSINHPFNGKIMMHRNKLTLPQHSANSVDYNKPIKLFNLQRIAPPQSSFITRPNDVIYGSAASPKLHSPKTILPIEQLMDQSSNSVNRLADPMDKGSQVVSLINSNSKQEIRPFANINNNTMSSEQESGFYKSQRDHLTKQRSVDNQSNTQKQIVFNGNNMTPEDPRKTNGNVTVFTRGTEFRQQPNVITGSIMDTGKQLETTESVYAAAPNTYLPVEQFNSQPPAANDRPSGPAVAPPEGVQESVVYGHQEQQQINPQQQMVMMNSANNQEQYQPDVSMEGSYLEFPISPQQWSSEAIKSMNSENRPSASDERPANSMNSLNDDAENTVQQMDLNNNQEQEMDQLYAGTNGGQYLLNNMYQDPSQRPFSTMLQSNNMLEPQTYPNPIHNGVTAASSMQNNMPVHLFPNYSSYSRLMQANFYQPRYVYPSSSSFHPTYLNGPMPASTGSVYNMPSAEPSSNQQPLMMQPSTNLNDIDETSQFMNSVVPSGMQSFSPSLSSTNNINQMATSPLGDLSTLNALSIAQSPQDQNNLHTLESANNDIGTLRKFQSSLGQTGGFGANNFTTMTRLAGNLRSLQGSSGQRGMPQIPNIPQPPQPPNIPMPPPGMMQMAGLALPFAMARATRNNRNRNNQVNAAANSGGAVSTTAGQRFLQSATSFTNRLINGRRKPNSRPATPNSLSVRPNRGRRYYGLVQTVIDMSRRPSVPVATSAAGATRIPVAAASAVTTTLVGAGKMKPKMDNAYESNSMKAKRFGRSIKLQMQQQKQPSLSSVSNSRPILIPNSNILASLNDGSVTTFASMTSPIDLLEQQLRALNNNRKSQRPQYTISNLHFPEVADSKNIYTKSAGEFVESQPKHEVVLNNRATNFGARVHFARSENLKPEVGGIKLVGGQLPAPLLAHNINLLLFSAQNLTGSRHEPLKSLPTITIETSGANENTVQEQNQQIIETQQVESTPEPGQNQNLQKMDAQQELKSQPQSTTQNSQTPQQEQPQQQQQQQQHSSSEANQETESIDRNVDIVRQQTNQQINNGEQLGDSADKSDLQGPAESVWAQLPVIQTTRTPVILISKPTTFSPVTTTTTTTTTTTRRPTPMKVEVSVAGFEPIGSSGWKAKSRRASKPVEAVQATQKNVKRSTTSIPTTSSTSSTTSTTSTTTTSTTTTKPPLKRSSSVLPEAGFSQNNMDEDETTIASADYVRAIKLVRGVAYPWPPPTKSSKVFSEDGWISDEANGLLPLSTA